MNLRAGSQSRAAIGRALLRPLSLGVWSGPDGAPRLSECAASRLERLQRLVSVVHVRAGVSDVVAAWHDGFHSLTDSLLADGLRQAGVAEADVSAVSRILRLLATLGTPG